MRLIIGLCALSLVGCPSLENTRALSALQVEFGDLVRTEAECTSNSGIAQLCFGDFKVIHGQIESQALAAIKQLKNSSEIGDRQITVALYRLAAYASLKADTNHAADHGENGLSKCAELSNDAPPRDCALLGVIGQYEVAEAFADEVNCLRTAGCEPNSDPEVLASGFCADLDKLASKTRAAKNQPFLPEVVKIYLDQQISNFGKSMESLASHLTSGIDFENIPHQSKSCGCVALDETDADFARDCGNLPVANRMATFKAECIIFSLEEETLSCPRY